MKLLAKTAEERYQTAAGLEADLRHCLVQWEAARRIDGFALGERDVPDRLMIPEKLYGRSREVQTLHATFDRIVNSGRPELVLVSGYSGIGKSSLVNELHKALVPPRGLFASGKFDQYKRDIPYSTLAQAFQSLVTTLLGKPEAELAIWREALREALGPNAGLVVNLVPGVELIIGAPPPVPELPPQDAQRRFQLVLQRFIGVFAKAEHPLALFLDDLQWLDLATLDLLEELLTRSDLRSLMLIGAYRGNEVTAAHPLARKLDAIRTAGGKLAEIVLAPLAREHLEELLTDALRCEPARVVPLAELVHEKTAGNPFFIVQFLSSLTGEGLLAFDHNAARWSWDLGRIHAKGYTDNVVDLMVGRLARLPAPTQAALQQLACLGNSADLATLALVRETPVDQVHADLSEAVRLDLVEPLDDAYRFAHDRVQEAAYSLIPEESRAGAHLRIGRLLVAHTPLESREEGIFGIVNQLNRCVALIISQDERDELAELNLIAGKRARDATAYASGLTYLTAGRALLPENSWERRGALTFALEIHRAECEFLTGAYAAAEERLLLLSSRARRLVDYTTVTRLEVELFTTVGRNDRAVEACLAYLRRIGIQWTARPTEEEVGQEYERLWRQIGNRSIEDLVDLPLMTDPEGRAAMDILTVVLAPALLTDDDLLCLLICRMANLSLEHGNSDGSCLGYVWLGNLLGARFGNYRAGFSFGKLGLDLVENRGLRRFEARVYLLFAIVSPWMQPVRTGLSLVRRAFEAANRLGDVVFAGYSRVALIPCLLATSEPLADVQREAEAGLDFARRIRLGLSLDLISVHLRLIQTLRGLTPEFGSFDDNEFDEGRFEQQLAEDPRLSSIAFLYWLRKLQARFFAEAYASAAAAAANAHRLWPTHAPAILEQADYELYAALADAALCDAASAADRTQHQEAVAAHYRQLQEWAENCPANFEDRAALVGAELARIEGRELDAERLYEAAIKSARQNEFVHNEALANELAARFYSARGFETISQAYLRNARYFYLRWGADGKVRQLDQLHPQLKTEEAALAPTGTIGAPLEQLDLATVIKVSQTVSSEMVLEKLLDTLMHTAIEHAGAERALLILSRGAEPRIAAEATTCTDTVIVQLRDEPVTTSVLPETILRYVLHTHENVILDDAATLNPFSTDPYIGQRHARSVLCLPLSNQAKLIGVLYLENNLAPRVFVPARTTVLKLLASQAAISLENARLYDDLTEREARIRRLVEANIIGIVIWNVEGRILEANEAFLRMVGHSREDLVSGIVSWRDVTPEKWRPADEHALAELAATGICEPFEKEYFRKDGSCVPVLVGAAFLEGTRDQGIAFVLDLSEQKRTEAEITALKDQLYKENIALRDEIDKTSMFEEIVGASPALRRMLSSVTKVAPTDSTVLITGETGTGKELIARAIHKRSRRSSRAFVSVNCAAIPQPLIASELFGHEKGAFTGALQQRLGRFELAEGGTIFLDEIGDLPSDTQNTLLRVLQEHEFERVGGMRTIRADVRMIAASNRDLMSAMSAGAFRSDLFYRLNVFPIETPSLRERREDIPMLVEYFIKRYATNVGKKIKKDRNSAAGGLGGKQYFHVEAEGLERKRLFGFDDGCS
jgi:PAS domain S-box-containing protein